MLGNRHISALAAFSLVTAGLLFATTGGANAGAGTLNNPTALTIPADAPVGTIGQASLYPSKIDVTNVFGPITDVNVTLHGLGHANPDDLDIMLLPPHSSVGVALMSDACGTTDIEDVDLEFNDDVSGLLTDAGPCPTGQVKPLDVDDGVDIWPVGSAAATLSTLDGQNAIGEWGLYVIDDTSAPGTIGDLELGWTLQITTTDPSINFVPGGNASPTPKTVTVSSDEIVTDVNLGFSGVSHGRAEDLSVLLVGPGGTKVAVMQDACGSYDAKDVDWVWDDEAVNKMQNGGPCSSGTYQVSNFDPGENLPAPAPLGPFASTLSAFDGTGTLGDWKIYVYDDTATAGGYLADEPTLAITSRPKAATGFSSYQPSLAEGTSGVVTISRGATSPLQAGMVRITTVAGTASAGDFTTIDEEVAFAAGEVSKDVPVAITDDPAPEGAETFTVQLSDFSGDAALNGAQEFTVTIPASDQTRPDTLLVKGPPPSQKTRATIKFKATQASTFECKVDKKAWKSCTSPLKLKNLKIGKHKVLVRATNVSGLVDPTPLKVKWTVQKPR